VGCRQGQRKFTTRPRPPSPLSPSASSAVKMSTQGDSAHEEQESTPPPSLWKVAWTKNKGIFLIILAQGVGSTMDAIVRFLQQGGHGMHPFQVRDPGKLHSFLSNQNLMWCRSFSPA
jgi:hypothetical protein